MIITQTFGNPFLRRHQKGRHVDRQFDVIPLIISRVLSTRFVFYLDIWKISEKKRTMFYFGRCKKATDETLKQHTQIDG